MKPGVRDKCECRYNVSVSLDAGAVVGTGVV